MPLEVDKSGYDQRKKIGHIYAAMITNFIRILDDEWNRTGAMVLYDLFRYLKEKKNENKEDSSDQQ